MKKSSQKNKILILEPSEIISLGLETIINRSKESIVHRIMNDISLCTQSYIDYSAPDAIIINPSLIQFNSQLLRVRFPFLTNIPIIALITQVVDEETLRQFDKNINIFDSEDNIVRKIDEAVSANFNSNYKTENYELSQREKEILVSVANGKSNKEIAEEHNISIFTVITHRKNITQKTGIKSVAGLTVYAILNKLIDIDDIEG